MPYVNGTIKTHKDGNPVRPIISSIGSFTYKLSKWLVNILTPLIGTISGCSLSNNVDFIDKLNGFTFNYDFRMISFDVKSLFTKVPVDDLLEFLEEEMEQHEFLLPTSTLIELVKLCIKGCKFTFDDQYYEQKFGMAMGNPLSPLLSGLYMEFFERRYLPQILPSYVLWVRYVDDIFCAWPDDMDVDSFLNSLNSFVPSIKFT